MRWALILAALFACSAAHAGEMIRACHQGSAGIETCIYIPPGLYDATSAPPRWPMPPEDVCVAVDSETQAVLRRWPVKQVWRTYWNRYLFQSGRYPTCDQ